MKTIRKNWRYVLWILSLIVFIGVLVFLQNYHECSFSDYGNSRLGGKINDAQKQTILLITELNKYILSINTLLMGALGFYLTKFPKITSKKWIEATYILAAMFFVTSFYYGFKVFSELTGNLAQDVLALQPTASDVFYYLKMSIYPSAISSLVLLVMFVLGVFTNREEKTSREEKK